MNMLVAFLVFSVVIVCGLCTNNHSDPTLNKDFECDTSEAKSDICRSNCSSLSLAHLKDSNNSCSFENNETTYPILTEACSYRSQKQKLRNEYFGLIKKIARDENEWQLFLSRVIRYRLNNGERNLYEECVIESESIGGNEGDYYKGWCGSLNTHFRGYIAENNFEFGKYKYPHMVLLGWKNLNRSISWNCGATLVHKSFVLTTANCVFKYGRPPDLARISEQRLISRGHDKFAIDYDVEKVVTHESFDSSKLYNDIALLKIKLKSGLGDKTPPLPICIWTQEGYPTINFKTLGYGSPSFGLSPVVSLRDKNSTLVSNADCSKFYSSNPMLPDGLRESQLCSSDPKRVTGGCKDDSGGPLQFTDTDELETPFLVGIASYGLRCRGAKPGVYTRIYNFLEWIESKMNENLS